MKKQFIAGQGIWGMPFIVSPNYVPQDPEYKQHYKPDGQGCPECNGIAAGPPTRGIPPCVAPVYNHEMDARPVAGIPTLNSTSIIGRSTRNQVSVSMDIIDNSSQCFKAKNRRC